METAFNATDDNGNIETDAHACSDEDDRMSSSSFHSEPALRAWSDLRQPSNSTAPELNTSTLTRSLVYAQSARPITSSDDKEHLLYLSHMPPKLQEDNCEILIINSEDDLKAARQFRNHLKKEILFSIHGQPRTPRVKLLHEIMHESINNLDIAFPKALYVFLYVTEHFCEQQETLLQGQACLTEAIADPDRKWCVVPVHTAPKKKQRYKLSMMLNCLRAIQYWRSNQDQFYVDGVRKLLESKAGLLLERDRLLDEGRKNYFIKHRSEILRNVQYMHDSKPIACSSSPVICSSKPVACSSSPVICSSKALEDSSKVSVQDSSNNASSVCHTDVRTHFSLPDLHIKSLPEASLSDVIRGMEEIDVSEDNLLPQSNSSERVSQVALQQPATSYVHNRSHDIQRSQHVTSAAANSNNNSFENVGQSAPTVPISASNEQDSSIVVDGPGDEENTLSTNPGFRGYQHTMTPNPPATSTVNAGPYAPANASQNMINGVPTTFMHSPMNPYFHNIGFGRPVFHPLFSNQGLPPQYFQPNYAHDPNLYQSMHHHPSMHPYNMQQLYSYANPIQQNTFCYNPMISQSQTSEPASYFGSLQMSTEVNAPNSLRFSLPDSSPNGAFNTFGSYPGMSNQWIPPHFLPLNSTPSHLINHHPASAPSTRPQEQPSPTVAQQTQSPNPVSNEQETPNEDQFRTGATVTGYNTQPLANSAGTTAGSSAGAANPVIQHIHHHHHEKKITVENATNVLIGDKSTFLNKSSLSDVAANDEESSEDNSETPDDENNIPNPTRLRGSSPRTTTSNPDTAAEPKMNVSDASGNGHAVKHNNIEDSIGFAECLSPVSTRQPVEVSCLTEEGDVKSQTDCKQLN